MIWRISMKFSGKNVSSEMIILKVTISQGFTKIQYWKNHRWAVKYTPLISLFLYLKVLFKNNNSLFYFWFLFFLFVIHFWQRFPKTTCVILEFRKEKTAEKSCRRYHWYFAANWYLSFWELAKYQLFNWTLLLSNFSIFSFIKLINLSNRNLALSFNYFI